MKTRWWIIALASLLLGACTGGEVAPSGDDGLVLGSEDSARAIRFVTVAGELFPPCEPGTIEHRSSCLVLGDGSVNSSAIESVTVSDESGVLALTPILTSRGIDDFNQLAAGCFEQVPDCATGRLAILTGDQVLSAPQIQAPSFARGQIQITGDFTRSEAESIAAVLNGEQ